MPTTVQGQFPKALLSPPVARAAYSDRTAWLMGLMSSFAYLKFESNEVLLDDMARRLASLKDEKAIKREVVGFIQDYLIPKGEEFQNLKSSLAAVRFELLETFSNGGTQAFLAKRESDRMAVLAFRGTEKNFGDIKTDLNARFYKRDGVSVHDGFRRALANVEPAIKTAVAKVRDYKLYITGHSLGGALALVATRALNADNVAACYTFGSPRVGNSEFADTIKVPIYRVVNAADVVPRVPPTFTIDLVIWMFKFFKILPGVGTWLVQVLEKNFRGYSHHGDMRYLTVCRPDFNDLRLVANPEWNQRVGWFLSSWKTGFGDHRIAQYCDKLQAYALARRRDEVSRAEMEAPDAVAYAGAAGSDDDADD